MLKFLNVLLCKHRDCILILTVSGAEFRGQFPYLDNLQHIRFIPWVQSQSDYQKFNIQCLVYLIKILIIRMLNVHSRVSAAGGRCYVRKVFYPFSSVDGKLRNLVPIFSE